MASIIKREDTVATFDISKFKTSTNDRYKRHIEALKKQNKQTQSIEYAVEDAIRNIGTDKTRSFVIYGEPQSGKTEMMIALTARLLDDGNKIVIHLLNDSVDLLEQNLRRFKSSGLSPSPKIFKEILDPEFKIGGSEIVIFCKKNSSDLKKLINKIGHIDGKVIVDDEADYASPNSKVNKGEKTKINELIEGLLGTKGVYIGVTATPARLDLNNTFENNHEKWVDFPPHRKYTGQDVFFPVTPPKGGLGYKLVFLPETDDSPKYLKEALFRFIVTVAYLNLTSNDDEVNFSMLIHTSGKKIDHKSDKGVIETILNELSDEKNAKYEKHIKLIWEIAGKLYAEKQDEITAYVARNKSRSEIVLLNSDRYNANMEDAANPASLFTIAIGGNIVSRGVTFNNLLSMFFTRDVRHKIQQDTYIQRARMFGARGDYLKYFELTIPEALYADWHRCFVFHKLAITTIKKGKGAPVWLSDSRVIPTAATSIDRSTVSFDKGEMSFALFDFDSVKADSYRGILTSSKENFAKLDDIKAIFGEAVLPDYLRDYINATSFNGSASIAIHEASSIAGYTDQEGIDKKNIERVQGFFGRPQLQEKKYPDAIHHFKVFYNAEGKARLLYKFLGSIKFIQNMKKG